MGNVLIRDVPEAELSELKAAAAARKMSLQAYLLEAVHAQATYERRVATLRRAAHRLEGRTALPEADRQVILDAIDQAHAERAEQLGSQATE